MPEPTSEQIEAMIGLRATSTHHQPPAADRATALTLRCGQLREQRDEARATIARVEAVVAPWPPGVRKGDVLRAIGGE